MISQEIQIEYLKNKELNQDCHVTFGEQNDNWFEKTFIFLLGVKRNNLISNYSIMFFFHVKLAKKELLFLHWVSS